MVYKAFGFTWMAIIFGVIGCTIILYSVLGSHENLELAKKPKLPFVKAFKETLQNKCFLAIFFSLYFYSTGLWFIISWSSFLCKIFVKTR